MAKAQNPPWLMWGSSQLLQVNVPNVTTAPAASLRDQKQTTALGYGRPDTFDFFFAARALTTDSPAATVSFDVQFDVTFGLGRSTIEIAVFEQYQYVLFPTGASEGIYHYSSQVAGPLRSPTDVAPNIITSIVAQEIYCSARLILRALSAANQPLNLQVECHSYFAPRTHVRPDWYGKGVLGEGDR